MPRFSLARLRQTEPAEVAWRAREAFDTARGRLHVALSGSTWQRRRLVAAIDRSPGMQPVVEALQAGDWLAAHRALAGHFRGRPARFVIDPAGRDSVVQRIHQHVPRAAQDARRRAERLLMGRYHLLGYTDLPFDGHQWHTDPIHGTTTPRTLWADIAYLDPACGDHKIIWEINRHQHWLELGRAYWLTGDERYRAECLRQLASWMAANAPLIGINWASMLEIGLRAISWVWALNFFCSTDAHEDRSPWIVDLLLGLDRQLAHLEQHLSYYFSPNTHLLGEALALYVTGQALPELAASAHRADLGRRILLRETTRQIAPDGGHCERSAHYHRYTLDFYLLALAVARLTGDAAAAPFERTCARLADAARALADDTGRLPHIGDDDGGSLLPLTRRAPDDVRDSLAIAAALTGRTHLLIDEPPEEIWWVVGHHQFADARARLQRAPSPVTLTSTALPVTGYYISRHGGDQMIIDGGPHGYLNAGHAHADALSLTFTRRGRPLLIDTGTGCYTAKPSLRDRFRSTALHNTLTIDDRSQSIPRGPFHWQHTANASTRRWRAHRRFDVFAGTHDGYQPHVHARQVVLLHDDLLVVADGILAASRAGATRHAQPPAPKATPADAHATAAAAVHWHVDPSWTVSLEDGGAALRAADDVVQLVVSAASVERFSADEVTGLGWHSPVYGVVEPITTLRVSAAATPPEWIVSAFGLDPTNRIRHVSVEPISAHDDWLDYGAIVRLDRTASTDLVVFAEPRAPGHQGIWRAGAIDSDAAMLCARWVGTACTQIAAADVATVRCGGGRPFEYMNDARQDVMFLAAAEITGADQPDWTGVLGKGSECVESLDSSTARG